MPVDVKWIFAKMKKNSLFYPPFSLVPSVCTYNATLVRNTEPQWTEKKPDLSCWTLSPRPFSSRVSKRHLPSCFLLHKTVWSQSSQPSVHTTLLEKKRVKNNRLKVHVFKVFWHIFDTFCFPASAQLFPSSRCAPQGRSFLTAIGFSARSSPLVWTGAVRRQTL